MTNILDINDAQLALATNEGLETSSGIALLSGGGYRFGSDAALELRRKPLETRTDYWASLNTQSLSSSFGTARHSADLVYAHLKDLLESTGDLDDLVIVTPANVSDQQLSLLLGILQSLAVDISAVVDRSLIATHSGSEHSVHIETQWRQALIVQIVESEGERSVRETKPLPGLGLLDLHEQILERCADRCVEQTRFDPRRSAESEQQLWNALPNLLGALKATAEHSVSLGQYQFTVSQDDITPIGRALMTEIDRVVASTDRWIDEPLLMIPGVDAQNPAVTTTTLANAAREIVDQLPSNDKGLIRIASLAASTAKSRGIADTASQSDPEPARETADTAATETPNDEPADADLPTHLLIGHRAVALASDEAVAFGVEQLADGAVISLSMRDRIKVLSLRGSYEQLYSGCRLYRDDGVEAMLIHIEH